MASPTKTSFWVVARRENVLKLERKRYMVVSSDSGDLVASGEVLQRPRRILGRVCTLCLGHGEYEVLKNVSREGLDVELTELVDCPNCTRDSS